MGLWGRFVRWWKQDEVTRAQEESELTEAERVAADEDDEAHKDDEWVDNHIPVGDASDYEADSEAPRDPTP